MLMCTADALVTPRGSFPSHFIRPHRDACSISPTPRYCMSGAGEGFPFPVLQLSLGDPAVSNRGLDLSCSHSSHPIHPLQIPMGHDSLSWWSRQPMRLVVGLQGNRRPV